MKIDLKGKKALVGGSTGGIGKATAHELALAGATVVLLARNEAKLKEELDTLPQPEGQKHAYLASDFTQPAKVEEKVKQYLQAGNGPFHILINNTGGPPGGPIVNADPDEFRKAFDMHVITAHLLSRALLPGMKEAGYGRIVNVISTSVKMPLKGLGVSNTVRGAMANWAKTMANELAADQITVNNVLPGATLTGRLQSIIESKAAAGNKSIEAISEIMRSAIPMQRFAKPEEIAAAIVFLASPQASYITGINLPVDGGRTGCL